MKNSDIEFYVDELGSEECFCGRIKKSGRSFCYPCFSSLSPELKRDLYQRIGSGYEEAYEAAVAYLDREM